MLAFCRAMLSVINSLKEKKHTADYILKVLCDMLKQTLGK